MEVTYGFRNPDRTHIEFITEQEALQDDYYNKFFTEENGLIKKIEDYSDQKLLGIDYYLDLMEDESQVLNELFKLVDYVNIFDRKTKVGNYFMERERTYNRKEPDSIRRRIRVFDEQDRIVCYSEIDKNHFTHIDSTIKYLYTDITTIETDGNRTSDFFYLEFSYDDNEVLGIDVNKGHSVYTEKYYLDNLDDMNEVMERFGTRTKDYYSYYQHAYWMP